MDALILIEPRIVNSQPLLLAGLRETMDQHAAQTIPLLWQKFVPFIGTTPHQVGHTCFGICGASDASQQIFYYMAAIEVSDFTHLPQELSPLILPSQCYAVFPHNEHVSRIKETIDAVFDEWLPQASVTHANQSLHFFERYTENYNPETGLGGMEIWLPIHK